MKWTVEEVNRITLFHNIAFEIDNARYSSPITAQIRALIPEGIDLTWKKMLNEFLDELKTMPEEEVRKIYRELPHGYVRFRILDFISLKDEK